MTQDNFEKYIDKMQKDSYRTCEKLLSKPIVLLPAGRFFRLSIRALDYWSINVDYIADKNPEESNGKDPWKYKNKEYIADSTINIVKKMGNKANYIVTSRPFREEIKRELYELGINPENVFHMPVRMGDLVPYSPFRRKFEVSKAFSEIEKASSMLSDEESEEQLWEILAIFCANSPVWIERHPSEEYFNTPYIQIEGNEVFVDAGMFDGATSERFIEMCPSYKAIYGIEANPANIPNIREKLRGYENIHIYNNALCNTDCDLRFKTDGFGREGARVDSSGNIIVKGIRGDDLNIVPTFVKFDIEGAEFDAIKGFESTIRQYTPKLAISAYHSLQDHWRLIPLIKEYYPDYKLYLKHHYGYEDMYGTILYAHI